MPPQFPEAVQVSFLINPLGLYIHIPFCLKKCNYCDFYSVAVNDNVKKEFVRALIREIKQWGGKIGRPIDTVYFGGGTPSLLAEFLPEIMTAVKSSFEVSQNAEITMEMNPGDDYRKVLFCAKNAGVNRLSVGVQSSSDGELKVLGRRHTAAQTVNTVKTARELGFDNISLDLMLGLPDSNLQTIEKSLEFVTNLKPEHISCYILKIEEKTPFYRQADSLNLPCEDDVAEQYLKICFYLKDKGYNHYEISNFSKDGKESKHNLKYWNCEEYLGLGPGAHSFLDGKRFYYPKSITDFISGNTPLFDSEGGSKTEKIMLKLRLKEGLDLCFIDMKRFSRIGKLLKSNGLLEITDNRIILTDKGMLLSNSIITKVLEYVK